MPNTPDIAALQARLADLENRVQELEAKQYMPAGMPEADVRQCIEAATEVAADEVRQCLPAWAGKYNDRGAL